MGVFLTILKILGIVLASLLGLIILILLLVLYAPVRYRLSGAYNGDVDGTVKVRWLFAGIKSTIVKNDEAGMSVLVKIKVFGIPIKKIQVIGGNKEDDSGGKAKKAKKKEKVKKKNKNKKNDQEITVIDPAAPMPGEMTPGEMTPGGTEEYKPGADGHVFSDLGDSKPDSGSGVTQGDASFADGEQVLSEKERKKAEKKRKKAEKKAAKEAKKAAKIAAKEGNVEGGSEDEEKNIADRIDVIYDKTEEILGKVSEKTEMIRTKKNHIIEFFDRPYVQNTIKRGKKVLRRLFKNLLPRKGDVNLLLGLKNPSSTGQIVGKVSMFYPYYYRWLHLTPEFHEQKIEADLWCKGRIHIGSFAIPALFMYLSKDFKKTVNLAKKI